MADLTPTGLVTRTQAEILAAIEADQRAEISPSLDQSTSSPLGQINRLFARSAAMLEEAFAALYAALDPDSNTGDAQARIAAITGTIREPATASRVTAVCDLDAGTYLAGTLIAAPAGRPAETFSNAEDVTSTGGATDVIFLADETGPTVAAASTLAIASPVSGWNAITSHPAVTPGQDVETPEALRRRRAAEVEASGSSSVAGIAADLTQNITEIESAYVVENDTDAPVDSIPPHAFEVIVFGPSSPTNADDDAVAAQIFASKAAGIATYGTTTRTVLDSQGRSHSISFTRPAETAVTAHVELDVDATYAGDGEAAALIAAAALAALVPGRDVGWSNVSGWAHAVPGVLRVTDIIINGVAFGTAVITSRQIATLLEADITISSTISEP